MNILFAPKPPLPIRQQAEELLSGNHALTFMSEDAPEYPEALKAADVLLGVPRKRLDAEYLAEASSLKFIQLLRKGVDKVDFPTVKEKGIRVATIGDLTAPFVAEHAISMLLALGRDLFSQNDLVKESRWTDAKPWQKKNGLVDTVPFPQCTGVYGKTLGLLGMGNIGKRVASIGKALGLKVQATTRDSPGGMRDGVPQVSLDTLLETSDFLSLHLTLSPDTRGILDASRLAQMRPGSFLINTARGQLIDENALVQALASGQIRGAGLDTLCAEPPPADHPLLHRSDVILSPHSGWLSPQSWETVLRFGFENIERYVKNEKLIFEAG